MPAETSDEMVVLNVVRPGFYLDSVALMRIAAQLKNLPGIDEAVLMIGTDANKQILNDAGVFDAASGHATPTDLIIAVRGVDEAAVAACLDAADQALAGPASRTAVTERVLPRTLDGALQQLPNANLALISTPGEFAVREARRALDAGLNVMLFSDNVGAQDEVALKTRANANDLLVMGPDCGTAYLGGVPVAFANAVAPGSVGIVAASGTGLQEVAVLLDRAGSGVSHGIGVGGRDLSDAVGGLSTLAALDLLATDLATEQIIVISKPAGRGTEARVRERAAGLGKPVTFCFLGGDDGVDDAITLKGAVEKALGHVFETFQPEAENARPGGAIRGLFCGGTLCAEAQVIARAAGLSVHSNVPVPGAGTERASAHHQFIDFGADEYTAGRPHPMIDPSVRSAALKDALTDPCVGVVLLDVVLGFGADDDPATHVCVVVESAPGDRPPIVAYVCGTDADPQVSTRQVERLRAAGVIVAPTNADAADAAVHLVSG